MGYVFPMKLPEDQESLKNNYLTNRFNQIRVKVLGWPVWQSIKVWLARTPAWKVIILGLGAIVVSGVAFLLGMILLVRMGSFGPLPTYAELANIQNNQASEVYDRYGRLLGKYYIENRVNADSSELPPHLVQALIATEDVRFFEHQGIDLRSMGRVLVKSILLADESSGGGSTISQQLAKNLYPREDYRFFSMIINKVKEMLVARRLEKTYSKEHILRLYLNTVPFDGNAYGVKIAAQRFFNKNLYDLKLEEAAVLVGMLKATTTYNPMRFPERAMQRRNTVLNQMFRFGYLDSLELTKLVDIPIKLDYQPESHNLGLATYFREHLRLEVENQLKKYPKPDGTAYNLYTDGLRIHTTLDATLQRYAEEAIRDHLSGLQKTFLSEWKGSEPWFTKEVQDMLIKRSERYHNLKTKGLPESEILKIFNSPVSMTIFDYAKGEKVMDMTPLDSIRYYLSLIQAGMLVAEPQSGSVIAWVGGIDHRFLQYDHVKSRRQIGSVIKPLVYAAAIRSGINPCEYFENTLVKYAEYDDWEPHNSDEVYGGYYSMEGALSHSVNTISVDLALETGLEPIRSLGKEMGIEGHIPLEPAIALGTVDASLWQMVGVYATFANQGIRPSLNFLERIETTDGTVLVQKPGSQDSKDIQVLTPDEAAIMTHLMRSVVDNGTARRLRYEYQLSGDIAGKTGTTQNQSDGWFIGYMPKLVAGVWIGGEIPMVHFKTTRSGQGSNTALPVWAKFIRKVQANSKTVQYTRGNFPTMSDTLLSSLNCPHYLPELPELFDSLLEYSDFIEFTQSVGGMDTAQLGEIMRTSPRKSTETLSEYSLRIRERNVKLLEKREKKKKRKDFFDKVFGRKEN